MPENTGANFDPLGAIAFRVCASVQAQASQESDDDGGDGDGGEEADGTSAVAHGDAPEVLEPTKEALITLRW